MGARAHAEIITSDVSCARLIIAPRPITTLSPECLRYASTYGTAVEILLLFAGHLCAMPTTCHCHGLKKAVSVRRHIFCRESVFLDTPLAKASSTTCGESQKQDRVLPRRVCFFDHDTENKTSWGKQRYYLLLKHLYLREIEIFSFKNCRENETLAKTFFVTLTPS